MTPYTVIAEEVLQMIMTVCDFGEWAKVVSLNKQINLHIQNFR